MPISPSDSIRLALTIGDPAGIGPEVLVKALSMWKNKPSSRVMVLSHAFGLNALARKFRSNIAFEDRSDLEAWQKRGTAIPCYFPEKKQVSFSPAKPQKELTRAAVDSIELGVELAMRGTIDALVTAPINKAALKKAGFNFPGHTEFLARLAGAKRYEMMLTGGPLRVVLVTRHDAIRVVPSKITAKRVEETILLTERELCHSFGIAKPRLAVCGLNPHAGEEGTIGREEITAIRPGVNAARRKTGALIEGPLPPDTVFYKAYQGRYDAVICMYHDQGLIPLKMISRGHGVNITLGLPFVRTSPDHGTAYDIAGKGLADPGSMIEAMETAFQIARYRKAHAGKKDQR
jgi:4-hydroxythreonine-4-phosphate dehydrogenase